MEAEKRTNRVSIDSEVFELPHSSFVLEPDYANITKRLRFTSQPLFITYFDVVFRHCAGGLNYEFQLIFPAHP